MLVAKDHRLSTVNARLDAALELRVRLHQERAANTIDVPTYTRGLRKVRNIENDLERVRRRAGHTVSRAVELCAQEGHQASVRLVIETERTRLATPPDPVDALLQSLSDHAREELAAGRKPGPQHSSGPLRPAIEWTTRGVTVEAYTAAEWEQEVAYHTYWRAHAYDTLDPELQAASPPSPCSVRRKVTFTHAQVRKLLEADRVGQQLELA